MNSIENETQFDFTEHSHRRFNPLTRQWILCSPHRAKRPWQGQVEKVVQEKRPEFDSSCYLCPGNQRVGGTPNPQYTGTFVFPNDFPAVQSNQPSYPSALKPESSKNEPEKNPKSESLLLRAESMRGECHVICFHPRHDLTMAEMKQENILTIVNTWTDLYRSFLLKEHVLYVQLFENKGAAMGCSNPHPHGQCWCTEQIPEEPMHELLGLEAYRREMNGRSDACLLCDYAHLEVEKQERIVYQNRNFICVVPWWAVWPFETLVLPKSHLRHLLDFNEEQRIDLADIMRNIACRYDNLFECSFPYSMGIHQAPAFPQVINQSFSASKSPFAPTESEAQNWINLSHFHLHFYPPLLRSATVRKFLVGFEMLGTPQRDLTSEQAASRLRALNGEVHYANRTSTS